MQATPANRWRRAGMITFIVSLAAVGFSTASGSSLAQPTQQYPAKEIELIIPFAPGGGVDLFGRTVARVLNDEKIVNKRIQVTNKPGAGGARGMAEMVQRKGDNHVLLGIAIHVHTTPLTTGTKYSYKDLTPIAKLFSEYQMMVVRTESPIKNLKQVAAALRKDIGSLKIGGASVGGADHMTVAKFAKAIGGDPSKLTYVAYSGGESNAAILGGHVDVGMGGLDLIDLVEGGKMRVLAVSAPARLGGRYKELPTFTELGYDVVNPNWRGIFGPPGMPPAIVSYWRDSLKRMVQTKAWKAELEKNQWVDTFESDTFPASLDKEHEVYRSVLQQLGLLKKK